MATSYLPRITEQNYGAFQRVLKDAPATFKEWERDLMLMGADLNSKGWEVESVDVDLDGFKKYCDLTQSPYTLQSLDNFAFKVGTA
jgi:hypothetical protein